MNTMKHKGNIRQVPEVFTLAEVASILRVSRVTCWRLATSGKLKAFRAGRGWRVIKDNLDKFIRPGRTSKKIKKGGVYERQEKRAGGR